MKQDYHDLPLLEFTDSDPEVRSPNTLRAWTDGSKHSNLMLSKHHNELTLGISIEDKTDEESYQGIFLTIEQAISLKNYIDTYIELAKLERLGV